MFNNIGRKIQGLATFLTVIGIGISFIFTIIQISIYAYIEDEVMIVTAIITGIIGCLASWLGSFFLYGFGKLIENSQILVSLLSSMRNEKNGTSYNNVNNPERYPQAQELVSQQSDVCNEVEVVTDNVNIVKEEPKQEIIYPKIKIKKLESNSVCNNCFVPFSESDNFCSKCGCTEHYVWRNYYGKTCDICNLSGVMVSSALVDTDGTETIKQVCQKCLEEFSN